MPRSPGERLIAAYVGGRVLSEARAHRPFSGPGAEDDGVGTASVSSRSSRAASASTSPILVRPRPDRRQQVVPDEVEDGLHVEGLAGDRDGHVLLGQHDRVLAVGSVAAVAVPRDPEGAAVTLVPVGRRVVLTVGQAGGRRRRRHPLRGQQRCAVPLATVEVELGQGEDRVRADVQPGEPELATGGGPVPRHVGTPEGSSSREDPLTQQRQHR